MRGKERASKLKSLSFTLFFRPPPPPNPAKLRQPKNPNFIFIFLFIVSKNPPTSSSPNKPTPPNSGNNHVGTTIRKPPKAIRKPDPKSPSFSHFLAATPARSSKLR
ncbi:hypothetical protein R3W88_023726 [Solanum pinnatisectum]|uniref:Uncharacterized protein n=1 Tax=Solanum pinnatisectum TaxID=50273 RepID=A0AAV9LZ67_9SOLN|nr:hypothetical protein R3W88_023726 [Solanum pinnatisectum]